MKKVKFNTALEAETIKQLKILSINEDCKANAIIEKALGLWFALKDDHVDADAFFPTDSIYELIRKGSKK